MSSLKAEQPILLSVFYNAKRDAVENLYTATKAHHESLGIYNRLLDAWRTDPNNDTVNAELKISVENLNTSVLKVAQSTIDYSTITVSFNDFLDEQTLIAKNKLEQAITINNSLSYFSASSTELLLAEFEAFDKLLSNITDARCKFHKIPTVSELFDMRSMDINRR